MNTEAFLCVVIVVIVVFQILACIALVAFMVYVLNYLSEYTDKFIEVTSRNTSPQNTHEDPVIPAEGPVEEEAALNEIGLACPQCKAEGEVCSANLKEDGSTIYVIKCSNGHSWPMNSIS